jgi:two-component system, response regulator
MTIRLVPVLEMNTVEIILVEDTLSDAELTIRALKKQNLADKLVHLKDGEKALEFLFGEGEFKERALSDLPKLVLLDLKMPKVNGLEVLARLKAENRTKKVPVIVLTSSKEDTDVEACYRLGANSYIVKPVNFDDFSKVVSDIGLYWIQLNHIL